MLGSKGIRVSIGMVLFILFIVVYIELRQTILMPSSVTLQNFIGKSSIKKTQHGLEKRHIYKPLPIAENDTFVDVLRRYADRNRTLSVSLISSRYVDMAVNFLKTSASRLTQHGRNLLFISTDEDAQKNLMTKGIPNFHFTNIPQHSFKNQSGLVEGEDYGSKNYFIKTNMKTWIVMEILSLGYTVLITDPDVVIFKDPFPFFTCENCDIHTQRDRIQFNTGFTYIRPTDLSKKLYKTAWDLYLKYHKSHDQVYISMALQTLEINKTLPAVQYLPLNQFMHGVNYYEYGNRMFYKGPCSDCVMVHNNYMGSLAGKTYRFKENLQWFVDEKEYYSSGVRKYITYSNPYFYMDETLSLERRALFAALQLAAASNRTLILPDFHCCDCEKNKCEQSQPRCSLLNVLSLKTFDSVYKGQYREHTFLQNPLVPQEVKLSEAKILTIPSPIVKGREKIIDNKSSTIYQGSLNDLSAMVQWIAGFNDRIIHFHSLYQLFADEELIGYECAPYQQWDPKVQSQN